jgi:hypothetical protein
VDKSFFLASAIKQLREDLKGSSESLRASLSDLEKKVRGVAKQEGPKGSRGFTGAPGAKGKDGEAGKDGISAPKIESIYIAADDHLVFKFEDGSEIDAGEIPIGEGSVQILKQIYNPSIKYENSWNFYVTSWTTAPSEQVYTGGDGQVFLYTFGSTVYYRFVPSTYDSSLDCFYKNFSDPVLSSKVATRGVLV